jgi:hypothetical protein
MQMVVESSNHALSSNQSQAVHTCPLLALGSGVGFRTEISGSGPALREEAGEDWLNEGSEHDLSAIGLRESHPQDKDEFECVIESYDGLANEHDQVGDQTYGTNKLH